MNPARFPIGVIGLGAMGGAIARRLLGDGWPVVAYDAVPAAVQPVAASGARAAASPAQVAAKAELIITSLPGEPEVREVAFGPEGVVDGATETTIVLDMSTLSPAAARGFEAELRGRRVGFVDAPVSGGPGGAETGSLIIMAGGDAGALERAAAPLAALGTVFHCGGPGAGQVCKACNQLIVIGTIELVAEALVLASTAGLDPRLVRSALLGGYAASRILDLHGERMLNRDFEPGGKARFNLKDIDVVGRLIAESGLALPAFEAAAAQIQKLIENGGGDLDNSALITVVEETAAVTG